MTCNLLPHCGHFDRNRVGKAEGAGFINLDGYRLGTRVFQNQFEVILRKSYRQLLNFHNQISSSRRLGQSFPIENIVSFNADFTVLYKALST